MTATRCPPFVLIPALAYPEMTSVAVLPASRLPGTVLMPFIVSDDFYDDPDVCGLPACSLSFVMLAGPWSARNSTSGVVPSKMFARFADDPDQAVPPLLAAGIAERAKGGGVRLAEGRGLTVVNAADVAAEAAKVREAAKERQRRSRANRAESRREKLNAANDVTCDIPALSHVTAEIDRSDQSQSIGVNPVDAHARDAWPPEVATAAVTDASKKAGRIVSEAEALRAVSVFDARAKRRGRDVHDRVQFNRACFKRERDIEAILAPPLAPEWLDLGTAPEPPPGAHRFEPSGSPYDKACARAGCGVPEGNRIHVKEAAG